MTDIPSREPRPVEVPIDGILCGFLLQPQSARGLVLFAHGGGSNRFSRRNRAIAEILHRARIATLLVDLLTDREQEIDAQSRVLRFNIPLLTGRLIRAVDWIGTDERVGGLALGLFGSGTGAAAAIGAAAERQREVRAVVCRGGRLDLAAGALSQVFAPTLLIVGGLDPVVLKLNRDAAREMPARPRLEIIPRATHLFEEAGKLDEVGFLSRDWFLQHFAAGSPAPDDVLG
jgi:pimeloyl-ACP methyl ester carboxylesterase